MLVEAVVQHAVQAVHLVGEARDGVFLVAFLGLVDAAEVAALAALRSLVGHLPDQPLVHFVLGAQVLRIELPGLLGDVQHDGAGLEDDQRLAAVSRCVVDHHRHAVIGIHLQERIA